LLQLINVVMTVEADTPDDAILLVRDALRRLDPMPEIDAEAS
jgi:hypothetical protein